MAFARFTQPFGIGTSRPPSSSGTAGGPHAPTSAPRTTARLASRTTELSLEQSVQAFSANQECDRLVIAGRDFLKIINVGHDSLTESPQLLRSQSSNRRSFIQNEVKWGNSQTRDLIATAATNGSIALYRDFRYDRTLQEHHRQVNRLAFNPADGRLLLSASQDGNVKLWDLREKKCRSTFQGKSEAVRDVQFNAANAVEFAAAYENGSIQRWDYRNPNACERKISNAHPGPVYSVAWHPDGKHCASGGRDKTVKVWDFYADPRRKSKHTIYTQTSLGRVVWRPGGVRTTELATCSIGNDYRIHLWDLKRPYMPTYVLTEHGNGITGLQFRDEEVLWSSGKDGMVVMHDVCFGHMPIGDLPMVSFAWNSENEFTFATQRRKRVQKIGVSGVRVHLDDDYHIRSGGSSVAEERSKKRESRSSSFRKDLKPAQQNSALDTLFEKFQPAQATARVNLQIFNFDKFDFLARYYVTTLLDERKMSIGKACERNARAAMHVGEYRTAKTWQILGYLLTREDEKIAAQAEQERLRKAHEATYTAALAGSSGGAIVARRLLGLGGGQFVYPGATPLSRPVPDTPKPTPTPTPVQMDHMINIDEALLLPPAAFGGIGSARSGSVPSSTASTDGDSSPRVLVDEDEELERGGFVDSGDRYGGHGDYEGLENTRETITSPRPILSLDTSGGHKQYRHHNQNSRYNNLYRRDSSSGEQPSFESSGAFFSTSGEESTSLERERRTMDNPPSTGSYEQPVFRTRPRQYSIGLMSEQTSGSYEERMMGLGSEREDDGDDGARMSLHAIQEEGNGWHNGNNSGSGYHNENHDGSTSNVNNNSSNNINNSAFISRNPSQSYLPHPPAYPCGNHPASKNNSTAHLDTTAGSHTTIPLSWYRPPAPPSTSSIPRLELNNQPHSIPPSSSCTPRPGLHQRLPYPQTHQQQHPQPTPEEDPPWSPAQLILELTDYYTSQGDVQFLATLVNLLNGRYPLPKRRIDEWVEGYVQLLHRKSQLKVAAEIVKWTPSGLVKAKGQTETFVSASCGWCGRAILGGAGDTGSKGFTWCESCKKNQDGCVICRKRVKGRWVACGICGHGGHEDCLRKWFFGDRVGREHDSDENDEGNDVNVMDDGEVGDKEEVTDGSRIGEDDGSGSGGGGGGGGGGTRRVVKNKRRRRRRRGMATAAGEDDDEDEENEDELEMDVCAAVGCAHECLPRNFC